MTTRRNFLSKALGLSLLVAGWELLLSACGQTTTTTTTTTPSGDCEVNGTSVAIGTNHGHTAPTVDRADVTAGVQKSYTIGIGSSGHTHTITVAASEFTSMQGNLPITLTTDADGTGHSHSITISCL